ncbi:MAG: RNA polymerase factor sigma-32 [Proteobacteria bacterium]|nr:RNA polymerase factor sigma-32 [Pseudomonadota bacterium]
MSPSIAGHVDNSATRRADLAFVRAAMRAPLLSRDREFDLARRWRDRGDQTALHQLITAYTRLVVASAARYRGYGLPVADLVQEGNLGLMQAAARFEPARRFRFSTYAAWWVRSAMQDFILRNWSIVRTGTTAAHKSLFFNLRRLRAKIDFGVGGPMTPETHARIARTLKVSVADVAHMEGRMSAADQSLDAPAGEESWQDFFADPAPNPEAKAIDDHDGKLRSRWMREALAELGPREQAIIRRRHLAEGGATLETLGREFGVSKERVRQLEHRALQRLRATLSTRVADRTELLVG